jgi:hypothetical protein
MRNYKRSFPLHVIILDPKSEIRNPQSNSSSALEIFSFDHDTTVGHKKRVQPVCRTLFPESLGVSVFLCQTDPRPTERVLFSLSTGFFM